MYCICNGKIIIASKSKAREQGKKRKCSDRLSTCITVRPLFWAFKKISSLTQIESKLFEIHKNSKSVRAVSHHCDSPGVYIKS